METFDLVIIGTGMGGGTLAYALRDTGRKILLLERGDFLPKEPENWSPEAVFDRKRYKTTELWHDDAGKAFSPGVHYFVGGNTKVYGAALPRFREQDFESLEHEEGISPEWPIRYSDLSPYYDRAEEMFWVHGEVGSDPTDPPRNKPFPFPALAHEPYIEDLRLRLAKQGLHPFYLPMGVDWRDGGKCIRCRTCDGFPCQVAAKADTETNCVRPALEFASVTLWTRSFVRRLCTDPSGQIVVSAEIEKDGETVEVRAETFVLSCGAANSAAVLLRSVNGAHPNGLANRSGLVGRNYMVHNNTALMAIDPLRKNPTMFQKTMAVNDFYLHGEGNHPYPLGNLQLLGKLQAGMLTANQRWVPRPLLAAFAERSVDWWVMSEDLPHPDNRITIDSNGGIVVHWKPTNLKAHARLTEAGTRMLRRAGYSLVFTQRMGIETNSHQCGTMRFGSDPVTSVLDPFCRTHEVKNLFVVDSAFFPSSAAVNPALTIAAQALRVADHIAGVSSSSISDFGLRIADRPTTNPQSEIRNPQSAMNFDVVTFGEAMVLLAPTESALLESAGSFHASVGGAELNCAIGLARLEHQVSWISRLGNDPFGQKILKTARGEGVDVSRVKLGEDAATGLMFKEVRPGSASRVFYYRKQSPAATLEFDQFRDLRARVLFVTGITPALSAHNRELTTAVVDEFRAAGSLVVFDPNMRFRLWQIEEARTVLLELAKRSDVLLPSQVDAEILCGKSDPEVMLDRLRELGPRRVAIKLGQQGVFFADEKNRSHLPCFPVSEIDPVGAGDAFCAGIISGLLDQVSFADSVRRGVAMGAFCVSSWGDYAGLPTRQELDRFLAGEITQGR